MDADRLLIRAARDGGPWNVLLAAGAVITAGAELLLPAVLGRGVDAVLGSAARPTFWLTAAVGLVLIIVAAETVADLAAGMSGARATARLRRTLVGHVLRLDLRVARRYPPGDVVSRLVSQVADAGQAGAAVVLAVIAVIPPIGSLVALTVIDAWLGVTFVIGLLIITGLLRAYVSHSSDAATRYQRTQSEIAARFVEALAGARTIGAAGTVDREIRRVLEPLPTLRRDGAQTWATVGTAAAQSAVVAPLLQIAVVAVAGLALTAGRLSAGSVLAALQYAALGTGLGAVVAVLGRVARSRAGSRRIAELLAAPVRGYGSADLPRGRGRLELRSVTVRGGDERPALDGVDLIAPAGATVAVVGRSGSGKSTLAAVAGRLLDPDEGEVTLDGVRLTDLGHAARRAAVGYAFARPVLVGETVGDAITLGDDRYDHGRAAAAARAAHVDAVVERLPARYDTRLADAPLSGGEEQRLGLARAFGAERLLILDDATSSLDTVTEFQVLQAIVGAADGRTRLVVTHRAGTAARADLVAWLDDGRLYGYAAHEVLWRDPEYRAVFQP